VRGAVLTVAAQKGGVGKTTLAYELAAVLDGVLVDLDFHGGGATNLWGFDPLSTIRAPLLDALEQGPSRTPRPKRRPNRPRSRTVAPRPQRRPPRRRSRRRLPRSMGASVGRT
jgi:cellulose biosynthesis protein BcsQ